jgi:hypothetical protein
LYGFEREVLKNYIDDFHNRFLRELEKSRGRTVSEQEKKQALDNVRGYIQAQYF